MEGCRNYLWCIYMNIKFFTNLFPKCVASKQDKCNDFDT